MKEIAGDVVGGLKTQPLILALVVVNCLFLGALIWLINGVASARQEDRVAQAKMLDRITEAALECRRTNGVPLPRPRPEN